VLNSVLTVSTKTLTFSKEFVFLNRPISNLLLFSCFLYSIASHNSIPSTTLLNLLLRLSFYKLKLISIYIGISRIYILFTETFPFIFSISDK